MSTEWHVNTVANPFYLARTAVEVETHAGRILTLTCPGCCRREFPNIKRWRVKPSTPPTNDPTRQPPPH